VIRPLLLIRRGGLQGRKGLDHLGGQPLLNINVFILNMILVKPDIKSVENINYKTNAAADVPHR
jgi:hypothetical protein